LLSLQENCGCEVFELDSGNNSDANSHCSDLSLLDAIPWDLCDERLWLGVSCSALSQSFPIGVVTKKIGDRVGARCHQESSYTTGETQVGATFSVLGVDRADGCSQTAGTIPVAVAPIFVRVHRRW